MEQQLRLGENDAVVGLKRAWDKALKLLAPEISRPSFESFFKTAKPVSMEDNTATIGVPSELAKIFLEKNSELIRTALGSILESEINLVFAVVPREQLRARTTEDKKVQAPAIGTVSSISLPLNDKYIFPNFVVGPCNKMAHSAAMAIAESPGQIYNPFFLYGGPGLGKTHLLQAIGHHVLINHPSKRVAYVSGEVFTSHYVTAVREHRSEDFRKKYRSIDVLLIDDIQFLEGKERTKEEFFHTFNALYQTNKQIVLCSDKSPRDLTTLEERLKSRFEAGLVADIAPPDTQTRISILKRKARSEKVDVSPQVLDCVASLIPTNVRALEGALITLFAYSSLMKVPLSTELAREVLSRYITEKNFAELTPDAVQRAVAQELQVDVDELRGAKRQKDLVNARHIAIYLSRELTDCSLQAIGKAFDGRDHATVIHACNRIRELIETDPQTKNLVERLTECLKTGRL